MTDLIYHYEQTREELLKKIISLNQLLKNENLMTIEREKLTARRDMLMLERYELLNHINDMKKHLTKEELSYGMASYTATHCRI